jgi:Flp pilus assembly protein CpaB
VRLAEPEAAAIVRAGDRVDVLGTAVGADGTAPVREAAELARGVRVLAVLGNGSGTEGLVIVVGATPAMARRLAGAAAGQRLTIAVRPP